MSTRYKLIVNVPSNHADALRKALGDAGAGRIGNYSYCSFSVKGTGRFLPGTGANPYVGKAGEPEKVEEEQIQVDVLHKDMKAVLEALKTIHPYEEPGYEIYQMTDESTF